VQFGSAPVRIDKWLWAARLLKTRALAAEAVSGGRVHVNGAPVRPSRQVRDGDRVELTKGGLRMCVIVTGTAERRGPAAEAAKLYEETPESIQARELHIAQRRLAQPPGVELGGRPTKRDRRRYENSPGARRRGSP
jgi:ribosome-associated heat shock protein Hsp15